MAAANLQFGPYRTERILGRGGMGVVYAAVEAETGRQVAVKVLTLSHSGDLRLRERFAAEIETLKLLKHPRIVELFGYGEEQGQLYYAMELVEGRSLQDELLSGRKFTWREAAQFGIETCDALRHAHDHGVVHRDLKPANLLEDAEGHIKLSDFGIAKLFGGSQLTADGGVLGTADYMSPEQAEGRPATTRSDLYSLGSVLYALLSRKAPFESKTLPEVIRRLIHEEPQPLSRLAPNLPDEFEDLVHQLLRKNPEERLPTAFSVAKRLQALLEENPEPLQPLEEIPDDEYTLADESHDPRHHTTPDTLRGTRPTMEFSAESVGGPSAASGSPSLPGVAVHLKPTLVRPDSNALAPPPLAEPLAPATRFTSVDKRARRDRSRETDDDRDPYLWLKLSGMALVIGLMAVGAAYLLWPPSADTLYGKISAAAADAERLPEVSGEIDSFLARFPNDLRAGEVAAWKEELDRRRLRKRLARQTRRLGETANESAVERLYLEALEDARHSPSRALERLEALVAVFGDNPDAPEATRRCVELAREEIDSLRSAAEEEAQELRPLLEARLNEADKLAESDLPMAQEIWRGVVALYRDKPWAAGLVARAQARLDP